MSNDLNRQDENSIDIGISSSNLSNNFLSNNSLSDNSLSNNPLSNNSLSDNSLSNNPLSNNFLSNNSLSDNSLSNNPLSNNSLSDNSLSNNSLSEITANNQKKRKHPGEVLLEEASNIHPQNAKQSQITKHFDHITSVPITKSNEIDQAILKAWVCCGFPFQTIENPFIIDLFRIAIPGYTLPLRGTLFGKLLDQETIRIEKKIENDLEHSNHLTIKYLIKLKNYNIEKQTGTFMAEEIQKIMQNIRIEKFVAIVTNHGANLRVAR
ncbi:hypothetical protein Glove_464g18 [Diversispora epigaea]|uniref:Uncharacterized protein n=1 Tax=Diversispora epigaea TaxID=1348612 RepID=A0A397GPF9_9GLOM|nr:hypothetical protein Glove_464g18 [Diversispora epigaea]